ncbi:MAG: hypothetical protein AAFQ94_13955 [Bacteroidota bacterium]
MKIFKIAIVCFTILLFAQGGIAQSYTIIHVKGDLKLADGTPLKRGTKLNPDAQLVFGSETAAAAAISNSRGRFVIKKGGVSANSNDSFYLLKAVLTPVKGRMSTRSGKLNNLVVLKKFFSDTPLAFLGDKEYVEISPEAFPQDYQRFFFLRYQYLGETINKKLLSDKQTMIWDKEEIFKVDGEKIEQAETSNHELYYLGTNGSPTLVSSVSFAFVPREELNTLVDIIKVEESGSKELQIKAFTELITDLYGKPLTASVEKLFE